MASVMAIVSKAVFEKMTPRNAKVGDVLETDRYVSSHATFEKLAEGDAIFLVTVRPPDERLWLVGILESPKRGDDAWVSAKNKTAIRDVTDALDQLKLANGAGVKAKKGALGMSLQTPRVLAPDDVTLLRGRESASDAYRAAVDAVPAAARARAEARAAAETDASLRFDNYRRPFAMLERLAEPQKKQLRQLAKQNQAGPITKLANDSDWSPMELVDVVEVASGKVTHQLYVWPYGAGEIFENDTTTSTARIIQHSYQIAGSDLPFRKALAAAYANASPQLSEVIEFRLDEDPPPPKGSEKDLIEAMKKLGKMLPHYPNGAVLFEALTDEQRAVVLTAIRSTESGRFHGMEWLGLPTGDATKRWAGLAPKAVLEARVGEWPVWKWLNAAAHEEVALDALIRALASALSKEQIAEVCREVAAHDDYALFASGHKYARGETPANAHTLRALRMLGALLDAWGDDAPIEFARAAESHLENKAGSWLAAIAMFGLTARARRRSEPFPEEFFALACKSDFLGYGMHLVSSGGFRDLVETLSPAQRVAFYEQDPHGFSDTWHEDRKGSRAVETPTPMGAWWYGDLLPKELAAAAVVDAIVAWSKGPKPKEHALELIAKIGPSCVPFLDRALAAPEKPPHRAVLVAARKLFPE